MCRSDGRKREYVTERKEEGRENDENGEFQYLCGMRMNMTEWNTKEARSFFGLLILTKKNLWIKCTQDLSTGKACLMIARARDGL